MNFNEIMEKIKETFSHQFFLSFPFSKNINMQTLSILCVQLKTTTEKWLIVSCLMWMVKYSSAQFFNFMWTILQRRDML